MADSQNRGRGGRGRSRGRCGGRIQQHSYGRQNGQQQYRSGYNDNGKVLKDGGSESGNRRGSGISSNNNTQQNLSIGHNYQGGRGGDGSQGDVPISKEKAIEIRNTTLRDVFQARPEQFPQYPEGQGTRLTLRPNCVNQHKRIWKSVSLKLNLFLIESKQQTAYQYDLQVHKSKAQDAPTASKKVYQQVFRYLQKHQEWPERSTVHDGRSTVWAETGDLSEMNKFHVKLEEYKQPFYVTFVFAQKIENLRDLQTEALKENVRDVGFIVPAPCLRLLDSVLRHPAIHLKSDKNYALRGRSIFELNQEGKQLDNQGVYEMLMGYRESVRIVREGLVLNLNTTYNTHRKALSLEQFLKNNNITKFDGLIGNQNMKRLSSCLKGVKVEYEVPLPNGKTQKWEKTIKGISNQSASDEYILNREMYVVDYFRQRYGYNIKYPYLNLLDVSTNNKFKVLVPMECCRIQEGQFERADGGKLQADLIRAATKDPKDRYKDIQTALQDVESRMEGSPADFWLSLAKNEWLPGVGHAIEAPIIEYGNNVCVPPQNGAWNGFYQNKQRQEFFHYGVPAKIDSWAIINMWENEDDVRGFAENIVHFGKQVGMQIAELPPELILPCCCPPKSPQQMHEQYKVLGEVLEQMVERCEQHFGVKPQIVFTAFHGKTTWYDALKGMLEGNNILSPIKVPSQCAQINKYISKNRNNAYISNLMKKVNIKLGGKNHTLLGGQTSIPQVPPSNEHSQFFPVMIMGADVTHSSVGNGYTDRTSVAAVVASMDKGLVRYDQRICVQKGGQEMISRMQKCTSDLLAEYQRRNSCLPCTIVFYRDGVSEGQFKQVKEQEYMAIKSAIHQFGDGEYNPTVTLVTVQKRHNYRPQADEGKSADDGSGKGNLAPGIVVDSTGLHPFEFQFLLNSHKTIQGTNRPALYQVLVDEAHFGAEQLIKLTYDLTYTYQRCSRSVSIPTPAYYAHLACTRARLLDKQSCHEDMFDPVIQSNMCWI